MLKSLNEEVRKVLLGEEKNSDTVEVTFWYVYGEVTSPVPCGPYHRDMRAVDIVGKTFHPAITVKRDNSFF